MTKLAINGGAPVIPHSSHVSWPVVGREERDAVLRVLDAGILSSLDGPEVSALEQEWAEYQGCRYVLATNGGTAAIHCALKAVGVGPGAEVITTAFSFSGTFQPIFALGATPVFADVNLETFNLDVGHASSLVGPRTSALLPVHIHGLPCDMDEVMDISRSRGLPVVEDAAQAHGATYRGKKVGTIGDAGCFSLNVTKNLPAGEGGLLCTESSNLFRLAASFRVFGEDSDNALHPDRGYESFGVGLNYAYQELPASFARCHLRRLDVVNKRARANAKQLSLRLLQIPGIEPPCCPEDRTHVYHKYRVRLIPEQVGEEHGTLFRDKLRAALSAEGCSVGLWHRVPMPLFPVFEGRHQREDFPNACRLLDESLIVFAERNHIAAQRAGLMDLYADAFEKVIENWRDVR